MFTAIRAMHTTFVNHPLSRRNHSNMIRTLSPKCVFMGQIPQSHIEVHNWYSFIRQNLKQFTTCATRMQTNNQGTSSGYAKFGSFQFSVIEDSSLLRYGASSSGNQFPTFRTNASGSYTAIICKSLQFRELCTPDRLPSDAEWNLP
jgi:hypothetical protein